MEKTLQELSQKLQRTFQIVNAGIILTEPNGSIVEVSEEAIRIFGYHDSDELLGRSIFKLTAHQEHQKLTAHQQKALKKGVIKDIECHLLKANGNEFLAKIGIGVLGDKDTDSAAFIFAIMDVTEQQLLEYSLSERLRELECLYDVSRVTERPSVGSDESCQAIANLMPRACGYPRIGGIRVSIDNREFKSEKFKETEWKMSSDIWLRGVTSGTLEINYLDADIEKEPYLTDAISYWNAVAKQLGKIVEHKQAEEALRDSLEFSSQLLDNAPNPILVVNEDTSIRYVNTALERLTGFSSLELIGRKGPYPWWVEKALPNNGEDVRHVTSNRTTKLEKLFQKKNEGQFWVVVTRQDMSDHGDSKYCLESWIDITEQKRLKENMKFYIGAITRAQEEERKRIANELHDGSIQTMFSLLNDINQLIIADEQLSEDSANRLEQIKSKVDSSMRELRSFSHRLRPADLDKFGLILAVRTVVEELDVTGQPSCSLEVIGPKCCLSSEVELTLFRIVQEALRNVRKHSQAVTAKVKVEYTHEKAKITIIDNGVGFKVPKILNDFARTRRLGILGMNDRATLIEGDLAVHSKLGKGTIVSIEVPIRRSA